MEKITWNAHSILSALLAVIGILCFVGWGAIYGVWIDVGIYALTITLVLFGAVGFMLSQRPVEE